MSIPLAIVQLVDLALLPSAVSVHRWAAPQFPFGPQVDAASTLFVALHQLSRTVQRGTLERADFAAARGTIPLSMISCESSDHSLCISVLLEPLAAALPDTLAADVDACLHRILSQLCEQLQPHLVAMQNEVQRSGTCTIPPQLRVAESVMGALQTLAPRLKC